MFLRYLDSLPYSRLAENVPAEDLLEKDAIYDIKDAARFRIWSFVVTIVLITIAGTTGYFTGSLVNRDYQKIVVLDNVAPQGTGSFFRASSQLTCPIWPQFK